MEWISVNDQEPTKDVPFLAATDYGIEKAFWRYGSYVGVCSCNCCPRGGCTIVHFDFWMELPKPPDGK